MFKLTVFFFIFIISQLRIQSSELSLDYTVPPSTRSLKILLVEDDIGIRKIFTRQINTFCQRTNQQIDVIIGTTHEEAIFHYKNHNTIDLILMDLNFPSTSFYCKEMGLLPGIVTAKKIRDMGYGNIMLAVTNVGEKHLIQLKRHHPFLFRKWRNKITNQTDLQEVLNLITVN